MHIDNLLTRFATTETGQYCSLEQYIADAAQYYAEEGLSYNDDPVSEFSEQEYNYLADYYNVS